MFNIYINSTDSILLKFKQEISPTINSQVLAVKDKIQRSKQNFEILGIEELVSAYASLLIYYDPLKLSFSSLKDFLNKIKKEELSLDKKSALCMNVPLCYDDEFGLDLDFVCSHTRLSKDELIKLHTKPFYRIYMLGFMAGFAYLGGLDERLFTPRLKSPRTSLESGSVGIADKQTGIYPIKSPGGWQIIARSPLSFFDKQNESKPVLLEAGMFLKFKAIDKKEYYEIKEAVDKKAYKRELYEYKGS